MTFERDAYLLMNDEDLSARCRISFAKGSGPGGQKRNKTSSLAKVELPELSLAASDCTERSQFCNRKNALKKLRMLIALNYRKQRTIAPERLECSLNAADYPLFAAQLLDILDSCSFNHRAAADICGCSPTAILKKIGRDPELWKFFQSKRDAMELPRLILPGK